MHEAEEEVQRIPARRYLFHNCPVCDSLARFPEESEVPQFFDQINSHLTSLRNEVRKAKEEENELASN